MSRKLSYLLSTIGLVLALGGCKPGNRAEIEQIKLETEKIGQEESDVDTELAGAKAELDVVMKSAGSSSAAERDLEEKTERLKTKLGRLEGASEAIKAQTESLKSAHGAYRKDNSL